MKVFFFFQNLISFEAAERGHTNTIYIEKLVMVMEEE